MNEKNLSTGGWLSRLLNGVTAFITPNFLTTALAEPATPAEKPNVFEILKKYEFTDNQEAKLNIEALKTKLKDKCTIVSFGFSRCKGICPKTNANLAALEKQHSNISNIVISTDPYDSETPAKRELFLKKLEEQGMDPKRVTILYPKNRDEQSAIQKAFGSGIVGRAPAHTPLIFLHDAEGNQLGSTLGNAPQDAVLKAISPLIPKEPPKTSFMEVIPSPFPNGIPKHRHGGLC